MRNRSSKDLAKRTNSRDRLFRREGIKAPRRNSERIVDFEALKRNKATKSCFKSLKRNKAEEEYFNPREIKRIILDNNARPIQHSPKTSYESLRTRKGLAHYIGALKNADYSEQVINDEATSIYDDIYGPLEILQQPASVDYRQKTMQAIAGAVETITDTQQKPRFAY